MPQDAIKRIGDYEVLGLIGTGAQGRVYRARYCGQPKENLIPGDIVALKVYNPVSKASDLDRFLKTAALFKSFNHPNIVIYRDAFAWDDGLQESPCLAMEYLEGTSLQEMLRQYPRGIPWEQARPLFQQFMDALIFARKQGVIHRDIKPANIFVFPDGRLKLIDFGVARREEGSQTSTAGWRGSFDYMAPDFVYDPALIQDFRGDEGSDIFSATVVFYEMLTGRLPFKPLGESGPAGYMNRWRKGAEPAPAFSHGIFRVLTHSGSFFRKGLTPVRQERFQSFEEMFTAFKTLATKILRYEGQDAYEFVEFIGQGGFGAVYKAKDLTTGETVAIKQLSISSQSDRFLREARLLKEHRHPNLVSYLNFIQVADRDEYYLVMECLKGIPGWSLRDRLKASGVALGLLEALRLFDAYLSALIYLHEKEVIHRDIKPSNLYAPPGNPAEAKIFDLGIARSARGTQTAGKIPGTLDYMAPEFVLKTDVRGNPGTDIYALGLSLYEAVTGRRAFPKLPTEARDAYLELRKRVVSSLEIDVLHRPVSQYPQLKHILQKATAKNPHHRYHSASAMQSDIRKLIDELESASHDDGSETLPSTEADPETVAGTAPDLETRAATESTVFEEQPPWEKRAEPNKPSLRRVRPRWIKYGSIAAAGMILIGSMVALLWFRLRDPYKKDKQAMQEAKAQLEASSDDTLSFVSNLAYWIGFGMQRTNQDPVYMYWVKDLTAVGEEKIVPRFSNRFVFARDFSTKEEILKEWRAVSNYTGRFSWRSEVYRNLLDQMSVDVGQESFKRTVEEFDLAWPDSLAGVENLKRAEKAAGLYRYFDATAFAGVAPADKTSRQESLLSAMQKTVGSYLSALKTASEEKALDQLTAFETEAPTLKDIFKDDWQKASSALKQAGDARQFELTLQQIEQSVAQAGTAEEYQMAWQRLQNLSSNLRSDAARKGAVEQLGQKLSISVQAWADTVSSKAEGFYAAQDISKGNAEATRLTEGRSLLSDKEAVSHIDGLIGKLTDRRNRAQTGIAEARRAEEQKAAQAGQTTLAAIQAVNALNGQLDQIKPNDASAVEACLTNAQAVLAAHQAALENASVKIKWVAVEKRVAGLLSDYIQQREPLNERAVRLTNATRWLDAAGRGSAFLSSSLKRLQAEVTQQQELYCVEFKNETGTGIYVDLLGEKTAVAAGRSEIRSCKVDKLPAAVTAKLSGPAGFRPDPDEVALQPVYGGGRTVSVTDMQAMPVKVLRKELAAVAGTPPVRAEWYDESSKDWKPVISEDLLRPGDRQFRFTRADYTTIQRTINVPRNVQYFTLEDPAEWVPSQALAKLFDAEARLNREDWNGARAVFETLKQTDLVSLANQERWKVVESALRKQAEQEKAVQGIETAWRKGDEATLNQLLIKEPVLESPAHRQRLDAVEQAWINKVRLRFDADYKEAGQIETGAVKQIMDPSEAVLKYSSVSPEDLHMPTIPEALVSKMPQEKVQLDSLKKMLAEKPKVADERQRAHEQYAFERNFPSMTVAGLARYVQPGGMINEYDLRLALYSAYVCSRPAIDTYRKKRSDFSPRDLRQWQMDMNACQKKTQTVLKDLQTILKGVNETRVLEVWQFLDGKGYADKQAAEWIKAYLIEFGGETKFAGVAKGVVLPKMKDEMSILRTAVFSEGK